MLLTKLIRSSTTLSRMRQMYYITLTRLIPTHLLLSLRF
jgi:hypothetical protein